MKLSKQTPSDFDEAIDWLRELDKEYGLTDKNYTYGYFSLMEQR